MRRSSRSPAVLGVALLVAFCDACLGACGARTGLYVEGAPEVRDAGAHDAAKDAVEEPPPPAMDPGPQIVLGRYHSCWRKDGVVKCWGSNIAGMTGVGTPLGNGAIVEQPTVVQGLGYAVEVGAGDAVTCARLSDWSVSCWGDDYVGSVGDGTPINPVCCTSVPRPSPISILKDVRAVPLRGFGDAVCVPMLDGSARCWGNDTPGTTTIDPAPVVVPSLANAAQIAVGEVFLCARWGADTILCAGGNDFGNLGDGTNVSRHDLAPVHDLSAVAELATGYYDACATLTDGTVKCWGQNYAGQIGDGTKTDRWLPTLVSGLSGVGHVTLGDGHACALMVDQTVRCWGANDHGQLGDGTMMEHTTPAPVPGLENIVELVSGSEHVCARRSDEQVFCWGSNQEGQLGDGSGADQPTPVPIAL
jgi:alpha-tubulin suppressor-like RCC1 family protein